MLPVVSSLSPRRRASPSSEHMDDFGGGGMSVTAGERDIDVDLVGAAVAPLAVGERVGL